jgi:hypothetical protein
VPPRRRVLDVGRRTPLLLRLTEEHSPKAPGRRLLELVLSSSGAVSTPVAAPPPERQPGALAGHRGSGHQQAHRQLPQPRQSRPADRSGQRARRSTTPRCPSLANLRAGVLCPPKTCFGISAVIRCVHAGGVRAPVTGQVLRDPGPAQPLGPAGYPRSRGSPTAASHRNSNCGGHCARKTRRQHARGINLTEAPTPG